MDNNLKLLFNPCCFCLDAAKDYVIASCKVIKKTS